MKLFILALVFASVASSPRIDSRVSSGYSAKAGLIKCYVQLVIEGEGGSRSCGACLIYPEDRVVTSASCVMTASEGKASSIKFYTGLTGSVAAENKDFSYSDLYAAAGFDASKNTSGSDVAVVLLNNRVKVSANLAATFPFYEKKPDAFVGENLVACGFGFTDNNKTRPGTKGLQCTTLRVVPAAECAKLLAPAAVAATTVGSRRKRQDATTAAPAAGPTGIICTKNNDDRNVCGGDQGGPVFSNKTGALSFVGVVSLYPDSRGNARCKDGHYVVVTQLGAFKDFIEDPTKPPPTTVAATTVL